jgi:hypothetical protein
MIQQASILGSFAQDKMGQLVDATERRFERSESFLEASFSFYRYCRDTQRISFPGDNEAVPHANNL